MELKITRIPDTFWVLGEYTFSPKTKYYPIFILFLQHLYGFAQHYPAITIFNANWT